MEFFSSEAVLTNIFGTKVMADLSMLHNVRKFVLISTDKAVNPTNVMGASKMMGERLMTAANEMRGPRRTRFASVRFGNVLGSRGSVVPIFANAALRGEPLQLTHTGMRGACFITFTIVCATSRHGVITCGVRSTTTPSIIASSLHVLSAAS